MTAGRVTPPIPPPRPVLVGAASILLIVFGGGLVATWLLEFVALAGSAAADIRAAVDGMTALVTLIITSFAGAVMLAAATIGGLEILVAVRLWRRIRWAWVEAIAVAVAGMALAAIGLAGPPVAEGAPFERIFQPAWAVAGIVGRVFVIVAVVLSRPWFGKLSLPKTRDEAPFWLRGRWFP